MVAEYVPAGIISLKPGLVPSGALVAEVLDLRGAIVARSAAASRPLKGPICTRSAYFGPERQPSPTEYACHSCQPSRAALDIVLIASASGWHGIDGLVALRSVAVRRAKTWRSGAGGAALLIGIAAGNAACNYRGACTCGAGLARRGCLAVKTCCTGIRGLIRIAHQSWICYRRIFDQSRSA